MRTISVLIASVFFAASCSKSQNPLNSSVDTLAGQKSSAPMTARCSQVTEIETIQIRETLLVQIVGEVVSGTYHYATGDRNSLTDTGFQHLAGKISSTENTTAEKISLKLKDATLSTYFDEDFAASKELTEINYDLKEKKISFSLSTDERLTSVGGCQFE